MKFIAQCLVIVMAAVLLWGCNSMTAFDYSPVTGTLVRFQEKGVATKTVAVMPFMDQRGMKYVDPGQHMTAARHPSGNSGSYCWGLLPLMPFGFVEKEEPEKGKNFVSLGHYYFEPQNDLANAARMSLDSSNLFKSVIRANDLEQAQADYVFRGKVQSTCYRGYIHTYLITYFAAPVLWLIGFPYGTSRNELWLTFELLERSSGRIVWTYDFRGHDYKHHWIYAHWKQDMDYYPLLMKQAMNSALWDLSKKMPTL